MNRPRILRLGLLFLVSWLPSYGQTEPVPLPDIPTLMHQVEAHQREAEAIEKDYIYRESTKADELDSHGSVKKTSTREFDVFWTEGVNVHRMVSKDGKELSPEEQKKLSEKIDKDVAKARERRKKADASGKETDPQGHEEVTVSRLLELGSFTNARRETINGRDTIVVDFTGDPKARTRTPLEAAIHDMAGTIWIDEADRSIVRMDAQFINTFKIGAGLLVSVRKGTSVTARNRKINDEVWLPESIEAQGQARIMLLFSFDGNLRARYGNYRKFKATSTILPGINQIEEDKPTPESNPVPKEPQPKP